MGSAWLIVILAGWLTGAYALTARTLHDRPTSLRLTGTVVVLWAAWTLTFLALSLVHQFRLWVVLVLAVATGLGALLPATSRQAVVAHAAADAHRLRATLRDLSWPTRTLLAIATAVVVIGMLPRDMVAPPLALDDLTFHVFKAGRWVNARGFVSSPGPGAQGYQDFFPATGEVAWSWFLLPDPSGAFLPIGSVAAWFAALLAAFSAVRGFGRSREWAAVFALVLVTVPASMSFIESSYTDTLAVFALVAAVAFLGACHTRFSWPAAAGAAAALGLALGTKLTLVPAFLVGAVWLVVSAARAPRRRTARDTNLGAAPEPAPDRSPILAGAAALGLVLVTAALLAPWYLRALVEQGSLLYPIGHDLPGGFELPGNAALDEHLRGSGPGRASLVDAVRAIEAGLRSSTAPSWRPVPVLWLVAGVAGAVSAVRARSNRAAAALLAVVVVSLVGMVLDPGATQLHTSLSDQLGRLLLPAFAALVLLASLVPWTWARIVALVLAAAQVAVVTAHVVTTWKPIDSEAIRIWAQAAGPVLFVVALGGATYYFALDRLREMEVTRRQHVLAIGTLVTIVLALLAGPPLAQTRSEVRYRYWFEAATGDLERVDPPGIVCLLPLWREADRRADATVAVVAPAQVPYLATEVLLTPFLGSSLQNRVISVPLRADGDPEPVDPTRLTTADERAWLDRLRDEHVDYVVVLHPPPAEAGIVTRHSSDFQLVSPASCQSARLYRFHSS